MTVSRCRFVVLLLLVLSLFVALRSSASPREPIAAQQTTKPKIDEAAEGERRFKTNCGRCHQPPQDLSEREARTVVRQMRVRAMLSAEDERLILKYLAP